MIPYVPPQTMQPEEGEVPVQEKLDAAIKAINRVLFGKQQQVLSAMCCALAGGHLLLEDLPGMGKTTLAHLLAKVLGLGSQRIQFTSDLLPSDILGVSIYNQEMQRFRFVAGPIFTQVLIADEINRSTPKTQSALLEAMAEGHVSIEGSMRELPSPFLVIATQNPLDQIGTYPLPESQMDRFLMRISMGYPDAQSEKALLHNDSQPKKQIAEVGTYLNAEDVLLLQRAVHNIQAGDSVVDYIQRLLAFSRKQDIYKFGISPRGGLALLNAAKAWALMHKRRNVLPEDVQKLLPLVWTHRLQLKNEQNQTDHIAQMLASVPVIKR